MRTSGTRSTPVALARPRPGRGRSSRRTSSADPPSSAWMKLACFVRHLGRAHPQPLQARRLHQPAGGVAGGVREHRPGVGPAGLVLAAPAHDVGHRLLGVGRGRPACRENSAHTTTSRRAERRVPVAESEAAGARPRRRRRARGRRPGTAPARRRCPSRGPRRSSAARRPPIPGTPTAHSRPCSPAAADCAGPRRGAWPPPRRAPSSASISTQSKPAPRRDHEAGEAGVGHEQVRALPEHQHGHGAVRRRRARRCTATRSSSVVGLDEHRGRRRPRGRWCAPRAGRRRRAAAAERGRDGVERRRRSGAGVRRRRSPRRRRLQLVGQRREVAGPEGQAQVARRRAAPATWARSSARPAT